MNKLLFICILSTTISTAGVLAETEKKYETPPSHSAGFRSGTSISDEETKKCIILYNEARWLKDKIENTQVDRSIQAEVDSYNEKIINHREMINSFNSNCAGKNPQSERQATQELNENAETPQ